MNKTAALLRYGPDEIRYEIVLSPGRRTLGIEVHPDLSVIARVPLDCAAEVVESRIRRRAGWINRQLERFRVFHPRTPPRRYVTGETHLYLGRQYRLRLTRSDREDVKLTRDALVVGISQPDERDRIKTVLNRWYRKHGKQIFSDVMIEKLRHMRLRIGQPRIAVRKMTRRWASLSAAGTMTVNTDLVRAPRACIEYVITHELCHLLQKHHSPKFYKLLSKTMPDWEQRKQRLELALL